MADPMQAMKSQRSMFNAQDVTAMAQDGTIKPDMTVRELFQQFGVDVDGPVSQLVKLQQDQASKNDPMKKMQALAGGPAPMGQPEQPNPTGRPTAVSQTESGGGLAELMRNTRRRV